MKAPISKIVLSILKDGLASKQLMKGILDNRTSSSSSTVVLGEKTYKITRVSANSSKQF